jgi:nonribosomal peptide synthetase DhbF
MTQNKKTLYAHNDSLHGRFEQQTAHWPQRIALSYRNHHLTYQQLNEKANASAEQLRSAGICPGDLVALMLPRGLDQVIQLLAILKAGAGYVPIDPNYPVERVEWMLESSNPICLLTQPNICDRLWETGLPESLSKRVLWVDTHESLSITRTIADSERSALPSLNNTDTDNPLTIAYIIFTSGSTGKPKGVAVGHHQVISLLDAVIPKLRCDHTDVWTLFHSLAFDFSVWEIWGALTTGGRLCIVPQDIAWSPDSFSTLLREEQVTILNQTPSAFYALTQTESRIGAQGAPALALRNVIFGGEALNMHQIKRWWTCYSPGQPRLINMYGITETTVHVTWIELTPDMAETDGSPIGEAIPGLDVYLLDNTLSHVADGEPGEMYVGGQQLALGYLGRPDLTASRFIANPFQPGERLYRSGDLAIRREGQLFYVGRADRQLKVRGFRIEPAEVEAAIETHPAIQRCAILPQPSNNAQTADGLIAFLIAKPNMSALPDALTLRHYLTTQLPVHCLPSTFLYLEALPLTVNGKLDQSALLQHWRSQQHQNSHQRRLDLLHARLTVTTQSSHTKNREGDCLYE